MSFFKSVLRAFGFGHEEDDFEDDAPSALVTPYRRQQDVVITPPVTGNGAAIKEESSGTESFPMTFFDEILEVFNNAQPEFVKQCLDRDAQRRYLYDVLGDSFKEYLERCHSDMEEALMVKSRSETKKFHDEISGLQERCKKNQEKEDELKQRQLSADRQKRALSDKVRELEQRVLSLEAEKEQFILENKSLVNKLKVVGVHEADAAAGAGVSIEDIAVMRTRLEDTSAENEKLHAEIERLNAEVLENAELYKTKMAMSDKMLSDIRNSSATSRKELDDAVAVRDELQLKYDESESRVKALAAELEEANSLLEEVKQEMIDKMVKVEDVLSRRDDKIKALKEQKESLDVKVMSLEKEIANLKESLEESVHSRAAVEKELNSVCEQLKELTVDPVVTEKPKRKRGAKKSVPKISAIDETLDSTEWLIATPPEGMVAKTTGIASDADFGYQEPPRKPAPDNAAQMSLF